MPRKTDELTVPTTAIASSKLHSVFKVKKSGIAKFMRDKDAESSSKLRFRTHQGKKNILQVWVAVHQNGLSSASRQDIEFRPFQRGRIFLVGPEKNTLRALPKRLEGTLSFENMRCIWKLCTIPEVSTRHMQDS